MQNKLKLMKVQPCVMWCSQHKC